MFEQNIKGRVHKFNSKIIAACQVEQEAGSDPEDDVVISAVDVSGESPRTPRFFPGEPPVKSNILLRNKVIYTRVYDIY